MAICPMCVRASSTATAWTVRGILPTGTASTARRSCSIRTRRSSAARSAGIRSLFAFAEGSEGVGEADTTDSAPDAPLAAVVDPAFTWGDDRSPRHPWHETIIYELHVKGFSALNRHIPQALRGTYLGLASEPAIAPPAGSRRHGRGADAGALSRGRVATHPTWPVELLGLQHPVVLRARQAVRLVLVAARRRARVQDDGPRAPRGGARGHSRRRLQPHGRRQPPGPQRCRCAESTTARITGCSPTSGRSTKTSPAAATRSTCSRRRCCT